MRNLGEKNSISWSTESETNNDYFTVQFSPDGSTWREINKVYGKGNSSQQSNYQVEHVGYPNEINYYKLSQTDFDGSEEMLGIVSIDNTKIVKLVRSINTLGQEVDNSFKGIVIDKYSDGTSHKRIQH